MNRPVIKKSTFDFLKKLSANNDRDWFAAHKDQYEQAKMNAEDFVDGLIAIMNRHDQLDTPSGKKSLYRIYNDVRFSKDKTPYSPRFAGYLKRVKPFLRGGYYFWIRPGQTTIGCGFTSPNADDLKRIRQDIDLNHDDWTKLLCSRKIVNQFGTMQGSKVRTAPRGFQQDHPAIGLLRFKQFWFEKQFTDREVLADDFLLKVNESYKTIRPFFDYMSDVLTTDSNGEPLNKVF
jgi:uncharacterized protein (TIGR02453 family)